MGNLKNKIDFLAIIVAERCNPNGDPLMSNLPRRDFDGYGEMSAESIKRKIRNRLQDMGEKIFIQATERTDDGCICLKDRAEDFMKKNNIDKKVDSEKFRKLACEEWIDVRSFGLVLPYKSSEGVTIGIRGPVSISYAKTIDTVQVLDHLITRSVNVDLAEIRDTQSMGRNLMIDKGVYVFTGGMFPQLAQKTGFTDGDAEKVKKAILTLFENDASSRRPVGSMCLARLYWWVHNSAIGVRPSAELFHSIAISPQDDFPYFCADTEKSFDKIHLESYVFF